MLPNAKSNRITVDEARYQYVIPLSITVQHREKIGAHLRVVGLTAFRVPAEESKFYMGGTVDRPIEPRHVAQMVRIAISRGWKPESTGPAFVLSLGNSEMFGENGGA